MTLPLVVLAGLAIIGGGLNLPFGDIHFLGTWLEPVVETHGVEVSSGTEVALAAGAVVLALVGVAAAVAIYLLRRVRPLEPKVLARAYYYDDAITAAAGGPGRAAFEGVAVFDSAVVDGAVNGIGAGVRRGGRLLRHAQSGFVRAYALGITCGVLVVLAYFFVRLYI